MESQLINDLFGAIDAKIFQIVLQLIVVGALLMAIKDLNNRIVNYFKLRLSDFGRGTKIEIDGYEGHIHNVGFNEVEITIDDQSTLLIPVDRFIKSSKVIITNNPRKRAK